MLILRVSPDIPWRGTATTALWARSDERRRFQRGSQNARLAAPPGQHPRLIAPARDDIGDVCLGGEAVTVVGTLSEAIQSGAGQDGESDGLGVGTVALAAQSNHHL